MIRTAAWLVACAAFATSAALIYQSQGNLTISREKLAVANQKLANVEEAQAALERMESSGQYATATKSEAEEDRFLTGLRKHAALAKATIVKYEATTARYDENGPSPVLAGLTRNTSAITLEGSYDALRTFLQSISASPRLYTFSDVRWSRLGDSCRLSMNMGRYVSPPGTGDRKL